MKKILALFTIFLMMFSFTSVCSNVVTVHAEECEHTECVILNQELGLNDQVVLAYTYQNVCWRCHSDINSNVNSRCSRCGWYICKRCGACESTCSRCLSWNGGGTGSTSKKSDNSWVWILVVVGIGVGGYFLYKKHNEK